MGELASRPVLDSDVLIDYLRGEGPGRDLLARLRESLAYRVTSISAFELALGRSYAANPAPVQALLGVPCLSLGRAAGLRAGDLLRELRRAGREIGMRDAMQAAICVEAEIPLVTRNVRHFESVEGLVVSTPGSWRP